MKKIKNKSFLNFLALLCFIHQTFQRMIYHQSDRVFIQFEQNVFAFQIYSGQSKDYEITFPNGQFKNTPQVLYSMQVYNTFPNPAQGFSITTLDVSSTTLKYRVSSLGPALGQIHFHVLAVDDPSIKILSENIIFDSDRKLIQISETSPIQSFSAFITGFKSNSGSAFRLIQTQNKVDDLNYTLELTQLNLQEVYLKYLIIYKNIDQTEYASLYSYNQLFDLRNNNPTDYNPVQWIENTNLVEDSQVLFGLKDFQFEKSNGYFNGYFGGKMQQSGNKLVSGNKVNIEYLTWDSYLLKNSNGLQLQFMVQNCEINEFMFFNQSSKAYECRNECSSLDHHYNKNPVVITLNIIQINMCQICNENCFGCVEGQPDKCIDCQTGKYLNPYNQKCEDTKPAKTYCFEEEIDGNKFYDCKQCHPTCEECSGGDDKSCTLCKATPAQKTSYLYKGQCLFYQPSKAFCIDRK